MESSLGWIDFSSVDRDRIKNVLNLLAEPGMVDELGIGSIRDSFSDSLFPGISTIQTRAKYFITIPRIIRDFEDMTDVQRRRVGGLARYLAEQEDECARLFAKPFTDLPDESQTGTGIIGISALKAGVVRKPSEIYWGGLRTFGLIRTRISRAEFCRLLDQPSQSIRMTMAGLDTDKGDDRDAVAATKLVRIPAHDPEWKGTLSIRLTRDEAEFLLGQMNQLKITGSFLSELLQKEHLRKLILSHRVSFRELPELVKKHVSPSVNNLLYRARDFWTIMEGAHIRYNCLLQNKFGTKDLQEKFEEQWQQWCKKIEIFEWDEWDISSLWVLAEQSGHRVQDYTRIFVERWCAELRLGVCRTGIEKDLDHLVTRQEERNKMKKSRLAQSGISVREWIGIRDLDYRFTQVVRITRDLQEGMDSHA